LSVGGGGFKKGGGEERKGKEYWKGEITKISKVIPFYSIEVSWVQGYFLPHL